MEDINKIVGENVRKIRVSKKLTQEEFGNSLGMKRTRIIQIEKGTQSPTLNTLKIISDGLGIKIKDLFD